MMAMPPRELIRRQHQNFGVSIWPKTSVAESRLAPRLAIRITVYVPLCRNRQDFSDRGADPKSLLDGALRRGSGEREAWIEPVGRRIWLELLIASVWR